jgi:hypothetical protein
MRNMRVEARVRVTLVIDKTTVDENRMVPRPVSGLRSD